MAFFSTALFAHQFWSTLVQTLVADLIPSNTAGAVAGMIGCASSFGRHALTCSWLHDQPFPYLRAGIHDFRADASHRLSGDPPGGAADRKDRVNAPRLVILLAKFGPDGGRGIRISRVLRDAGMEVAYAGLH
jgi:hypothetical protein